MNRTTQANVLDFINGQQACQNGAYCPPKASKSFKQGYGVQYELQANRDYLTRNVK